MGVRRRTLALAALLALLAALLSCSGVSGEAVVASSRVGALAHPRRALLADASKAEREKAVEVRVSRRAVGGVWGGHRVGCVRRVARVGGVTVPGARVWVSTPS